jgi:hypothetical protein
VIEKPPGGEDVERLSKLAPELYWDACFENWKKWLLEGVT